MKFELTFRDAIGDEYRVLPYVGESSDRLSVGITRKCVDGTREATHMYLDDLHSIVDALRALQEAGFAFEAFDA